MDRVLILLAPGCDADAEIWPWSTLIQHQSTALWTLLH